MPIEFILRSRAKVVVGQDCACPFLKSKQLEHSSIGNVFFEVGKLICVSSICQGHAGGIS